jgi:hypothetical protein
MGGNERDTDRALIKAAGGTIRRLGKGPAVEAEFVVWSVAERGRPRPDWPRVLTAVGRVPGIERLFFAYFPGHPELAPTAAELWPFLAACGRLKDATLCEVQVETFAGMPDLPGLERLGLALTGIVSFEGMPRLPALRSLDLCSTQIMTFDGMPDMPGLTDLDVGDTGIASFAGMPALPALTRLNLGGTRIASLAGMPWLPTLTSLDLIETPLATLDGMPALPGLTSLSLGDRSSPSRA